MGALENFLKKKKKETHILGDKNKKGSAVGGKRVPATRKGVLVCGKRCWCMEGERGAGGWKGGAGDSKGVLVGGNEVLVGRYGVLVSRDTCWGSKCRVGVQSPGLALACCGLHWPVLVFKWVLQVRGLT